MAFEVTILGNSSASPTLSRHPSSQYINICDHHLLVDCGEGTQMQLQRYKIKKSKISHIFISHVHGDHILGLPGLLLSMNLVKHEKDIHVYGPKELFEILDVIFKHSETELSFPLHYHPIDPNTSQIILENSQFSVKSFPLFHRIPTIGYLFKENNTLPANQAKSYAYCSDTLFDERVIKSVADSDYLYHEATFMHDKLERAIKTMHSTAMQAGLAAKMANVNQLLIGHFSSRYDDLTELLKEAQTAFPNTQLASEGTTFVL